MPAASWLHLADACRSSTSFHVIFCYLRSLVVFWLLVPWRSKQAERKERLCTFTKVATFEFCSRGRGLCFSRRIVVLVFGAKEYGWGGKRIRQQSYWSLSD